MLAVCEVETQTALLISIADVISSTSTIVRLFGDPNNYASIIDSQSLHSAYNSSSSSNSSRYQSTLPVRLSYRSTPGVNIVKGLTVDSLTHLVYLSNGKDLGYGAFIYDNESAYNVFDASPRTNQVKTIRACDIMNSPE